MAVIELLAVLEYKAGFKFAAVLKFVAVFVFMIVIADEHGFDLNWVHFYMFGQQLRSLGKVASGPW